MSVLDDAALARLWDALAERLQRNGLEPRGIVTLSGLDRSERYALAGLVGRPIPGHRARVDLQALDIRLRSTGAARNLVAAVEMRRGPLVDRPGARTRAAAERAAAWRAARGELELRGLGSEAWVDAWLESVRPVVARLPASVASDALVRAAACISRLPRPGLRCGRTELANRTAGDSHSLDDGSVLAALVLRAIAVMTSRAVPESAPERRALWEVAGVLSDEVSTTVMTLGLLPLATSAVAAAVRLRSEAGCETHLTIKDLRRLDRMVPKGKTVWVCENPRVLEAAMEAGAGATIVCTSGNPTVVATTLLERLAGDGVRLFYRGDFDWPGIAIANRILNAYAASPWRMACGDYEQALAAAGDELVPLPPLEGRPVVATWDAELTAAMQRAGRAVHEEAMLDVLVGDLS